MVFVTEMTCGSTGAVSLSVAENKTAREERERERAGTFSLEMLLLLLALGWQHSSGPCLMMIYKACIMKVFIMLKIHSKLSWAKSSSFSSSSSSSSSSSAPEAEKCNQVGPRRHRRWVLVVAAVEQVYRLPLAWLDCAPCAASYSHLLRLFVVYYYYYPTRRRLAAGDALRAFSLSLWSTGLCPQEG